MKKVHLTENKFTLLVENSIDRKVNKSIAYYARVSDFNEIRKIRATILNHIPNGRVRGGKWLPRIVSWFLLGTMPQSEYKRLNKFLGWLRDNKYPNSDINDTDWHNLPFSYIKEAYDDLLDNGQEQPSDVAKINKKVQKINGYTIRRIDSQEEGNYVGHVYGYAWCILDSYYDEAVDDCAVYIISNDKTLNTAKPIPTRVIKDKLNKMGYSEIADELYDGSEDYGGDVYEKSEYPREYFKIASPNNGLPPYDEYGLSAIVLFIGPDGDAYGIYSRYNMTDGDGNLFGGNKTNLSNYLGINLDEACPYVYIERNTDDED